MIRLSREIRFALALPTDGDNGESKNSWAGWPTTDTIAPQLKLQLVISGTPDEATGYLCNIKLIDQMLRKIVTEDLIPKFNANAIQNGQQILDFVWNRVANVWPTTGPTPTPSVELLKLYLSPYLVLSAKPSFASLSEPDPMPQAAPASTSVSFSSDSFVTQQFEFSAAHRLHCETMSEDENQQLFGKCNNPNGHGHNYVLEVTVEQHRSNPMPLRKFEAIVKRLIIDPLDHKHLNEDVPEFSQLNPTVENIATVIFGWLEDQFDACKLESVKVFETPKTWAERRAA